MISRRDLVVVLGAGIATLGCSAAFANPPGSPADLRILNFGKAALKVKIIGSGAFTALPGLGLVSAAAWEKSRLSGVDGDNLTTFWRYFLRSAQPMFGGAEGGAPVVGYFNPLLGYWWLTQWAVVGGRYQIADAKFVPDSHFSVQGQLDGSDDVPAWIAGLDKRSLIENLRLVCRDAARKFNAAFAFQGSSAARTFAMIGEPADTRADMIARFVVVGRKVADFLRSPPTGDLTRRLIAAWNSSAPLATGLNLSPEASETFAAIAHVAPTVRGNMALVGALPVEQRHLLVFSSAQAGRFMIVAVVDGRVSPPRVERLGLVDTAGRG